MDQSGDGDKSESVADLKPLYVRSVVNSFGSGTVGPFLSAYAVKLGASASEMGLFQSVSNLAPNLMQVPWGRLSNRIGRRIPLIILGSAFFNLLTGMIFFVGSLIGGYLGSYFIGVFGLALGLQIVYAISATGRIVGGLTFTTLREPYKYPSTLRKELLQARLKIPPIWERG